VSAQRISDRCQGDLTISRKELDNRPGGFITKTRKLIANSDQSVGG
jgi:hypothetical protein